MRRPQRSTLSSSSAASDVYKRQELNDKYLILNEKEMKFLRKCLKSRKQDVRWTAAEILVGWYTSENERLLYNLTYDKAELVCVDATDSLCIGRTRRSLSRLRDLMEDKRSRVRGYAVLSFFQVWVNCFSWNEKSMRAYLRFAETMEAEEKKTWVRLFYEENKILARGKKGFDRLFYMLEHSNDYYVKAAAIQTAKDMRTVFNQEEINAGLEKAIDSLEYEYQKEDIKKYIQKKEPIKILLLDRENSGVTQLLEYMGEETEMYVRSAGLHPSGKIEKWVLDILMKEDDITRYQCSSPIEKLCKYDYLIPVGIHLNEKAYPFQKIYARYQDFDKKQISWEEAKEMICQIEENLKTVSYTHLRAHETDSYLVCRLLLEKKKTVVYDSTTIHHKNSRQLLNGAHLW